MVNNMYSGTKTTMQKNKQVYPVHKPYGKGTSAKPGRVVWSHNPKSVKWDGKGYWWKTEHFNENIITEMIQKSIASLGGKNTAKAGWTKPFQAQNKRRGNGKKKYKKGEKIAIKANINGSGVFDNDNSGRTKMSYTNPVLLKALLSSFVNDVGVASSDITVYDVSHIFPVYMVDMCTKGELERIHFVGRNNGVADKKKPVNWSYSFKDATNYLPTCVTQAKYIIKLVTKQKKNSKTKSLMELSDKILLRKRAVIESVNDFLKNICQIEHSRHRSCCNFVVNLVSGIAAYSFLPKKPSIQPWNNAIPCRIL